MSSPHIPFEQRFKYDPSDIDPSCNMHFNPITKRPEFDRKPGSISRRLEPLQAIFNPQTGRFCLIDQQANHDPTPRTNRDEVKISF